MLQPFRSAYETLRADETHQARGWLLRAGTRLAVDVGSTRIGVARCDPDGLLASPLATIRRGRGDLDSLTSLAARLAPLPVRLVDERFTTAIAHDALRQGGRGSRARRPVVDKAAAALILQGALDTERTTGRPAGELVGSPAGAGG